MAKPTAIVNDFILFISASQCLMVPAARSACQEETLLPSDDRLDLSILSRRKPGPYAWAFQADLDLLLEGNRVLDICHQALGRNSRGSWSVDLHIQPLSGNSSQRTELLTWGHKPPYK